MYNGIVIRKKQVVQLLESDSGIYRLAIKFLKLANEWSEQRSRPSKVTKKDLLVAFAHLLYEKGIIRIDPVRWVGDVYRRLKLASKANKPTARSLCLPLLIELIDKGIYTQKQIVDQVIQAHPAIARSSVNTYLSDAKNWKFSLLADVGLVVKKHDRTLCFDRTATRPDDQPRYRRAKRDQGSDKAVLPGQVVEVTETPVVQPRVLEFKRTKPAGEREVLS